MWQYFQEYFWRYSWIFLWFTMLPTVQKRIPSVAIFISLSSQPHFNTHNNTHNNDEDKGGILKWFLSKKTISKTWMFFRIQILFLSPDIQKLRLKSWTNVKKREDFWLGKNQQTQWLLQPDWIFFTWHILFTIPFAKYHLFAEGVLHTFGKFGWRCDESGD